MKHTLTLAVLLATLLLSACATGGQGEGNTQAYGEIKGGYETSQQSH